jgi:hypothetical protein
MIGHDFLLFKEYFIKHITVMKDKPVLIQLKNHQSRLYLKSVQQCHGLWSGVFIFPTAYHAQTETLRRIQCIWRMVNTVKTSHP